MSFIIREKRAATLGFPYRYVDNKGACTHEFAKARRFASVEAAVENVMSWRGTEYADWEVVELELAVKHGSEQKVAELMAEHKEAHKRRLSKAQQEVRNKELAELKRLKKKYPRGQ